MSEIIVTEGLIVPVLVQLLITLIYTLILRNCNYCLLSNNYSITHKLAFWVLCKNNAPVPEQMSTRVFQKTRSFSN